MPAPATIRVKLSTEEAGDISITPVVVQEIPLLELIERMLPITGKDVAHVRELLLRGTLVCGASRFRWTGWDADPADVEALFAHFPDPDPSRPFAREMCVHAVFHSANFRLEVTREAGARRRWFQRESFWDVLLAVAADVRYHDYSYGRRADHYRLLLTSDAAARLRRAARLLRHSTLARQIEAAPLDVVDFFTRR
jgi:hypothetical protein